MTACSKKVSLMVNDHWLKLYDLSLIGTVVRWSDYYLLHIIDGPSGVFFPVLVEVVVVTLPSRCSLTPVVGAVVRCSTLSLFVRRCWVGVRCCLCSTCSMLFVFDVFGV